MTNRSGARRYLAFDADLGGFNNIVMHFEIMVTLAWLTGRTLVLPPPRPFYLLGPEPRSLLDFFDLGALENHLSVVTAEEFAPEAPTHESFHARMNREGFSPGWNADTDALAHPPNALTTRLELIPRLFGRRPVGLAGPVADAEILYFPTTIEHRMFGQFEAFFLFADPADERRARTVVRDAIRYRPEIFELAKQAIASPPLAGEPYSAMHIRRGDFKHIFKNTYIGARPILDHTANLFEPGELLYLATEETAPDFLRPFKQRYRLVRYPDLTPEVTARVPHHWTGIVETLICAAAPGRFAGTRLSTFSARIAILRGHRSRSSGPDAGIDTALYYTQPPLWNASPEQKRPYSPPLQKHADEHGETATPWWESIVHEPVWGRAHQSIWAQTGE